MSPGTYLYQGKLTKREIECLNLAAKGKTISETAKALFITPRTVNYHFQNILKKLGAKNKTHAACIALVQQYITLEIDSTSQ